MKTSNTGMTTARTTKAHRTRARLARCVVGAGVLAMLSGAALGQNTDRVTVRNGLANSQGNGTSGSVFPSYNGYEAVFASNATNLVSNDTNGYYDVFVRSRETNTTVRISVPDPSMGQAEANGFSSITSVSGARIMSNDGRFVVFASEATNLVPNDTNGVADIFVRDRDFDNNGIFDEAGVGNTKTIRVNLTSSESQAIGPCPNDICDHYAYDACISGDGRFVAFVSSADLAGESVAYSNVYVRDRDADNDGIFDEAGGVPDAAKTILVSRRTGSQSGIQFDGFSDSPAISENGRHVAFVSLSSFLVFSDAQDSDLDVYVRDIVSNTTTKMSQAMNGSHGSSFDSRSPSISANGRYVAFQSAASGLVAGDTANTDIFVRDRDTDNDTIMDEAGTGSLTQVSMGRSPFPLPNGSVVPLNADSTRPSISRDGTKVAFQSDATNATGAIFAYDTNNASDILVRDLTTSSTSRVSLTKFEEEIGGASTNAIISPLGNCVGFVSGAAAIDGTDNNGPGNTDGFIRTLVPNAINNDCGTAILLPSVALSLSDMNFGNDRTTGTACSTTPSPNGWYRYTAACTGTLPISISQATFDPILAVMSSCGTGELACNDDTNGLLPAISLSVTSGETYYIRVTGFNADSGFFTLIIDDCESLPCPADFNDDGGIDGSDVEAFFEAWQAGQSQADVNGDGGIDGTDVEYFYAAWQNGGC